MFEDSELVKSLVDAVVTRDEVVRFAKDVFANVKLEVVEEEGDTSRGALHSKLDSRKSMMVTSAFMGRDDKDSPASLQAAVKQAERVWHNLRSYVELLPTTVRYLCKMIVAILRKKCGDAFPVKRERWVIAHILIIRVIVAAISDPIEYNAVVDCMVSDAYTRLGLNIDKVLNALIMGTPFPSHDPLATYANHFIEAAQYQPLNNR